MKVRYAKRAIEDLSSIADHIAKQSRQSALNVEQAIKRTAETGLLGPAIYVNIIECPVHITPYETDLNVLREIADQLGK